MPIDPRIPFLALGGGGGGQQRSPLSSLAEVYQLRQQIESGQLAEEQRRLQQLEIMQRMQLAQQQAQREQTKFGQEQRQFGIGLQAQRAIGGASSPGAISDDEWAQMMEPLGPEVRLTATTLRNKLRSDLAAAAKAEAEAVENLEKARVQRVEAVAGSADATLNAFGPDPDAFAGWVREVSTVYPDEVRRVMSLLPAGTNPTPEQITAIYRAAAEAAPSRAPKVVSPGQQIATAYGARYTAPPAKLGAFQLSGGPGTQAVQYNEQGQPVARLNVPQSASQAGTGGGTESDAVDAIVTAIIEGTQPPTLTGLYRYGAKVRAGLAEKGYNLSEAQLDWQSAQRHFATMNNPQQTRLRQAVDNAAHALDVIDTLAEKWKGSNLPILNRANLALAKGGGYPPEVQSIATQLEAQIADLTSELANVYMGGNSPTEQSLKLAAHNLSADWSEKVLKDMVNLARKNLQIRRNAIANTGPISSGGTNQYVQPPATSVDPKDPAGIRRR